MSSFKRSRPIIRLSISKWQRSTLAVMTARLIMSSVWGAVGFSACVDVAALRLIASAARVAFFMAWFPEISIRARPGWMAKPYSQDLRERMVRAVLAGQSRREVARMFDVSVSCMIKLMQRVDATSNCRPRKFGGHKHYALAEQEDKVRAFVAETPDLTITELWQKITALGIRVGRSAVARFLLHLQLTFKKNPARPVCKWFYRDRRE